MKSRSLPAAMLLFFWFSATWLPAIEPIPLWVRKDYKFTIRAWSAEQTSGNKTKMTVVIAYEIPRDGKFMVHASRSPANSGLDDSISNQVVIGSPEKGEATLIIEDDGNAPLRACCIWLWRGAGRMSPSGAFCEGSLVDFTPKITPVIRHSEDKDNTRRVGL
jgi:hypothetical protein